MDALYEQLNATASQYDSALEGARTAESAAQREQLDAALGAMRREGVVCAHLTGCDTQRFQVAYAQSLAARRQLEGSRFNEPGEPGEPDASRAKIQATPAPETAFYTAVPNARRTRALLGQHRLSDLIANNGAVQAAIEVWLTRARPQLIRADVDYQYLRAKMWPAFRVAGLPEAVLFGLMAQESGGQVHAVSRAGAAGPLQFMPGTGARFGLTTVDGFDERFDPRLEAQAAAAYLNQQLGALNNNLALVLAAYNGGEGLLGRLAAATPNPSFWDPGIYSAVPEQTRTYVPLVLAAAWLFLHPARYNLHFPVVDGQPGHVTLTRAASLDELAVCLGDAGSAGYGWYRTLRNLNPRLDPVAVQPAGTQLVLPSALHTTYESNCTHGRWLALADQLQAAQPLTPVMRVARAQPVRRVVRRARPPRHHYVTVHAGNTLYAIAKRYDCASVDGLARVNGLHSPADITIGQRLELNGCRRS
ncbi:MAG TPA: transglycosylase SLT domain-containing protein [Nevskiaceae bacterium]|nr:transglycosylase SLT domain-containing protein [Nevskiaceae bacterium]